MVTIAYWDTEGGSRPPRLLGDYQGTPTIRLFKPKKKQRKPGSVAEKQVLDYQHGERNSKDLKKFLEYQLPNYVERIKFGKEDYHKAKTKADKYGLPVALLFTTKASTSTTVKWLSTEFRRRVLILEIPPSDKNQGLREELVGGSKDETGAALYVIPGLEAATGENAVKFEGDKFSKRKLQDFLAKHALKNPVLEPIAKEEEEAPETKQKQSVGGDEF